LRGAQQLGFHANVSTIGRAGTISVTAQIQQSADGRNWLNKNSSAELAGTVTFTTGPTQWSFIGSETWPTPPPLRFVQVMLTLHADADLGAAIRLTLYATARFVRTAKGDSPFRTRGDALAALLGIKASTLTEVVEVTASAKKRSSDGFSQLTRGTRGDLAKVRQTLLTLKPDQRRDLLNLAAVLAKAAHSSPVGKPRPEPPPMAGEPLDASIVPPGASS